MELIQTERLWVFPMTAPELEDYVSSNLYFGSHRALCPSERPLDPDVIELFEQGILPLLQSKPAKEHIWYTAWCIVAREENVPVGDFCFYAPPQEEGWTEIGYGIYPKYQSQGYMTEILRGVLDWCGQFPQLKILKARTEPTNIPSNRLLATLGFLPTQGDAEGNVLWEKFL